LQGNPIQLGNGYYDPEIKARATFRCVFHAAG
jgi:hypothetical protein